MRQSQLDTAFDRKDDSLDLLTDPHRVFNYCSLVEDRGMPLLEPAGA